MIPRQYIQWSIADMALGEVGYTRFWAMYQAKQNGEITCWINSRYPIMHQQKDSNDIKIERVADGIKVTIPLGFIGKWDSRPHSEPNWGNPLRVVSIEEA